MGRFSIAMEGREAASLALPLLTHRGAMRHLSEQTERTQERKMTVDSYKNRTID